MRPLIFTIVAVAVVGSGTEPGAIPGTPDPDPAAQFAVIEERLLTMRSFNLGYVVRAEGAFEASLDGTLEITRGSNVSLEATGIFGNDSVRLHLHADASSMTGGSARRSFSDTLPAELKEALILGLTRMGILHNLARLTAGLQPDRADGGVREWVVALDIAYGDDDHAGNPSLVFTIFVAGTRAAEATLWFDPVTGLPVRREQIVSFPGGTMRVTESYDFSA